MHWPALPLLMLLQCHNRLKNRLGFIPTARLIQAAEPAKSLTVSSHSCLCGPSVETEQQFRHLSADRRGDASVNTYKLNTVLHQQSTLPCAKPAVKGWIFELYFPKVKPAALAEQSFVGIRQIHSRGRAGLGDDTSPWLSWTSKSAGQTRPANATGQLQSRGYGWNTSTPPTHRLRGKYLLNNSSKRGRLSGQLHTQQPDNTSRQEAKLENTSIT